MTYTLIVGALILVFGTTIHLLYKRILHKGKYQGLSVFEGVIIVVGRAPGLAGCVSVWTGIGFPLPLIIGLPVHLIFIGNKHCGWTQSLFFNDPGLTQKFAGFPIAWITANIAILALLYYFKIQSRNNTR